MERQYSSTCFISIIHDYTLRAKLVDKLSIRKVYISQYGGNNLIFIKSLPLKIEHSLKIDIEQCIKQKKRRFFVVPVGIIHKIVDKAGHLLIEEGHMNILIYDIKKKTLEIFEPQTVTEHTIIDVRRTLLREFIQFLNSIGEEGVRAIDALDFCPRINFQNLSVLEKKQVKSLGEQFGGGAYCVSWSFWYAELRLLNPDVTRAILIREAAKMIEEGSPSFIEYIASYLDTYHEQIEEELTAHRAKKERQTRLMFG